MQFAFFDGYYDVIKELSEDDQSIMYKAIMRYVFDDIEPNLQGTPSLLWKLMKPSLAKSKNRSHKGIAGKKKSNKTTSIKSNRNQIEIKTKSNTFLEKEIEEEDEKEIEGEKENKKEKDKTPPGAAIKPMTAEWLIEERDMSSVLESSVKDWVRYKTEKRQGYKPTGLKSLLTEIQNMANEYGDSAVVDVIQRSMSCNYAGIGWYWLKEARGRASPQYDGLAEFAKGVTP